MAEKKGGTEGEPKKKRRGRPRKSAAKKPEATRRSPGRPPEYGENEVPNCCRFCGSKRTKRYGQKDYGAPPNVRRVRYRECQDCKDSGRAVFRYTSNEFLSDGE